MRAYLRVLPDLYERKAHGIQPDPDTGERGHPPYSPAQLTAYVGVLCLAEQQPRRGRFKSERLLRVLLEGPDGQATAAADEVPFLIEQGDLIRQRDGSLYVEGWDELQEGNWQVAERMRRYRARRRGTAPSDLAVETPHVVTAATQPAVTPVTVETVTGPSERLAVGGRRLAVGAGGSVTLAECEDGDLDLAAVDAWMGQHRVTVDPGTKTQIELARLIDQHGADKVLAIFDELAAEHRSDPLRDGRQYVWGASKRLNPIPTQRSTAAPKGLRPSAGEVGRAFARA